MTLVGGLLATSAPALAAPIPAAGTVLLAPAAGPLGTVAVIRGTCTEMYPGAGHIEVRVGFSYSNAFNNRGVLSAFHRVAVPLPANGTFIAKLQVGPAVAYTPTGAGPAAPGVDVLRKPKVGDLLTVQAVCFSKASANPAEFLSPAAKFKILAPILTRTTPLRVAGVAKVGAVVSPTPGGWRPAPTRLTYQWLRAGRPIVGATAVRYTLKPADLNQRVAVRVTATRAGYRPGVAVSAAVLVTAAAPEPCCISYA